MDGRIGFVGAGAMGGPMVRRLIAHGHGVLVCDRDGTAREAARAAGADIADSPAEVASQARHVFASLPTPDIVEAVALGPDGVAAGGAVEIFVDLSTSGPDMAVRLAEGLSGKGIVAVDAPVSGGIAGASAGTLAVMASGPRPAFDAVEGILRIIGSNTFHIGEAPGSGQMMKIVNNLLSATAMAATGEAVVLGVKAGLDPDVMVEVFNASSGMNTATRDKFPRAVLPRSFDFGFRTELLAKDVRLCVDQAERLGVPMWVGQAVRQWWSYAHARGGDGEDFTNIVRYMEEQAGVEVRSRRNDPSPE